MNYYELEPENNTFHTILVDLTHRCPINCANCYIPNRDIPDMDENMLYDVLSRLPFRTDIRLMGAEVTTRNDLPEIITEVRRLGHRPSILTAGLRMKSKAYCKTLQSAGLRSLGLSMNGADDDELYALTDGGPFYAKSKMAALENCLDLGLIVHINCIIMQGVNEHLIEYFPKLLTSMAIKKGRSFSNKYPLMIRYKNVGQIGRYQENSTIPIDQLIEMCADAYGISKDFIYKSNNIDGYQEQNTYVFPIATENGKLYIKLTDWQVNSNGIPDPNSKRRGRITPDGKIAPFFEHVKENEGEY